MTKYQQYLLQDLKERREQLARLWRIPDGMTRDQACALWGTGGTNSSGLHMLHYGQWELLGKLIEDNS